MMQSKMCPHFENPAQCPSNPNAILSRGLYWMRVLVSVIFVIVLGCFAHWAQAATYADPRPAPHLDNAVPILDAIRGDNLGNTESGIEKKIENTENDINKSEKDNQSLAPEAVPENPLPTWVQWLVGILAVGGSAIAFLGSLGLLRLRTYYERVHAPSIIATMGCWLTMWAVIIFFSASGRGPAFSLLLIAIFVGVTVPITTIFLMRAALFRSRRAGENVPPSVSRGQIDRA